jgi:tetratricopeptide (TPR) repeat protein/tRNA A-37 threonylcarbamoyl transferase component Bud32
MDESGQTMPSGRRARPSERVDAACDRFEAAWRVGGEPHIEDYLAEADEADRQALLGELVALERELRRRRGERPVVEEYLERFPAQAGIVRAGFGAQPEPDDRPGRPQRDAGRDLLFGILALQNNFIGREDLVSAFAAWVADKSGPLAQILVARGALDEPRRALLEALLAEHLKMHGGDTELSLGAISSLGAVRGELERLGNRELQASLAATTSRAAGAGGAGRTLTSDLPSPRRTGSRFRVLSLYREGGLGRVYLARDEELGRAVALKEMRPDKVTAADLRTRFMMEAEITGGLEHPGIVPIYSLGTYDDGRPFYAMRFVEGDSLKEAIESYHREHSPSNPSAVEFRKLLGRFVDVCEAIEFAHSKGVLHRDIKPGNIIVGRHGETLVIDWGLAKATGQADPRSGERSLMPSSASGSAETLPGSALGTPSYMSPEQAKGDLENLGPRSDVYSLGATLYCLLTGQPPLTGETSEIVRAAQKGEFPAPRLIDPALDPALEAVCLKAMALRAEDRYSSCEALAADIERWMAGEPVSAWREPISRRARRWLWRNRTAAIGAAAALLAGLIGLAAVAVVQSQSNRDLRLANKKTAQALEAETQAKDDTTKALGQSEQTRQRAEAVLQFLKNDVLAAARPEGQVGGLGVKATVREAVDAAEPRIAGAFKDHPLVEADIRNTVGATYWFLGEAPQAIQQYQRVLELRKASLGPDHADTLISGNNLGNAYQTAGRISEAIELLEATLKRQVSTLGPDHADTLICRNNLALAYQAAGRIADAIKMDEATLKQRESTLGPDDPDTLTSRNNLAEAYAKAGRNDEALKLHEVTVKQCESTFGPDHPNTLSSRMNLANAYSAVGRTDESIKLHEATLKERESKLGPDHLDTLINRTNLAAAYTRVGRAADAVKLHEATLKMCESKLGPDHPNTLVCLASLASAYRLAGQIDRAIPIYEQTLKRFRAKAGPDHPHTLTTAQLLADAYNATGQHDQAIALFEEALEGFRTNAGPHNPNTLATEHALAGAYVAVGHLAKAEMLLRDEVDGSRKQFGPADPRTATAMTGLGSHLIRQRKWSEGEPILREALAIRQQTEPDEWSTFNTRSILGENLLGQKKFAEAEPLVLSGYEGMKAREAQIPSVAKRRMSEAAQRIVQLYDAWAKPDQSTVWKLKLGLADLPADIFDRP